MSLYRPKGSKVYVYDFQFAGMRIRETTHQVSITRARMVYDKRRQELRDGASGIRKQEPPKLLSVAASDWQTSKELGWSAKMRVNVAISLGHLLPVLGKRLLVDIDARDITRYQKTRLQEGASGRTVNIEVGALRQIMRKHGAWARLQGTVKMLPERQDVGHALTPEEESMLLVECGRSRSRILLPFVVLALETGARYNTIRMLQWRNIDFANRCLKFGKDKTAAGTGRVVPLNQRAVATLEFWAQQFPNRIPEHFVFPAETYGGAGTDEAFGFVEPAVKSSTPTEAIHSIKEAWEAAKRRTRRHCPSCRDGKLEDKQRPEKGYVCGSCHWESDELPQGLTSLRFHDLRHSAVSRMIAARVPLPIVAKIVGWAPGTMAKMAARYGHFGMEELRGAVEVISTGPEAPKSAYPQKPHNQAPQSSRQIPN